MHRFVAVVLSCFQCGAEGVDANGPTQHQTGLQNATAGSYNVDNINNIASDGTKLISGIHELVIYVFC